MTRPPEFIQYARCRLTPAPVGLKCDPPRKVAKRATENYRSFGFFLFSANRVPRHVHSFRLRVNAWKRTSRCGTRRDFHKRCATLRRGYRVPNVPDTTRTSFSENNMNERTNDRIRFAGWVLIKSSKGLSLDIALCTTRTT